MRKKKKMVSKAKARMPTKEITNSGYSEGGASHKSNILKAYRPVKYSSKADINANLYTLRNRSADQAINTPIGSAAINTSALHTIGVGLHVFPRPKFKILGMDAETARDWSRKAAQEFDLWASSTACDISHRNSFYDLQDINYTGYLVDGDAFCLFRRKPPTKDYPYSLRLQLLEGNRISNPLGRDYYGVMGPYAVEMAAPTSGNRIISGVEIDMDGAVVAYWVSNKVPGDPVDVGRVADWIRIKAFGDICGMPNMVQTCHDTRPEQYRGVPYLAPVIETLKQVSRYTSAELTAAIVKSFFALFFTESNTSGATLNDILGTARNDDPMAPVIDVDEYALGPGTMNALPRGVDVKSVDAARSMSTFDTFTTKLLEMVGSAIGQPYEVLMKHFTSSYSASRAALLQAWEEYKRRRVWFARDFCQPVYEMWLAEAIAMGRIEAPGFFTDPLIRKCWCNANWYGPTMSILDPLKDVNGSALRTQYGLSTREREAAEMTGTDFEENIEQLAYEQRLLEKYGIARGGEKTGDAGKGEKKTNEGENQ